MAVVTTAGKQISVPEQFELRPLSQEYLSRLKLLNSVIFPVKYHVRTMYGDMIVAAASSAVRARGAQRPDPRPHGHPLPPQDTSYQQALACGAVSQLGALFQARSGALLCRRPGHRTRQHLPACHAARCVPLSSPPRPLTTVAFEGSTLVGAIMCRLEALVSASEPNPLRNIVCMQVYSKHPQAGPVQHAAATNQHPRRLRCRAASPPF